MENGPLVWKKIFESPFSNQIFDEQKTNKESKTELVNKSEFIDNINSSFNEKIKYSIYRLFLEKRLE